MISASVQNDDPQHVFHLLEAGAIDIFPKPITGLVVNDPEFNRGLIEKLEILSGVKVFTKKRRSAVDPMPSRSLDSIANPQIVVIGASTGGPQALYELLSQLPANFPVPIVCVQHICPGFLSGLVDWLANDCSLTIGIARSSDRPQPGHVYFAPEKQHLELDDQGRFWCTARDRVDGHCPSVTVTFQAMARFYGQKTMGILLTGMGRDGADGLHTIAQAGGLTIAQDEATSVVFGMPKEAIKLGGVKRVLPIQAIASTLWSMVPDRSFKSST